MERRLLSFAQRFLPDLDLDAIGGLGRSVLLGDVVAMLYALPLTVAGVAWLLLATDWNLVLAELPVGVALVALLYLVRRQVFFLFAEVRPGVEANFEGALDDTVIWSAALIFGPTALWPSLIWRTVDLAREWRDRPLTARWNPTRNYLLEMAGMTVAALSGLALYRALGGAFPLPGLTLDAILPALAGTLIWNVLNALLWLPIIGLLIRFEVFSGAGTSLGTLTRFLLVALGWPFLVTPFAILAAGLYSEHGVGVYGFFIAGLLLATMLAHQLSSAVDRNQQRSREMAHLEALGRAIIDGPPDASTLRELLVEHVPRTFSHVAVEICLFPNDVIVHTASVNWPPIAQAVWDWLNQHPEPHIFSAGQVPPWQGETLANSVVIAPILDEESGAALGGIYAFYVLRRRQEGGAIAGLNPAVQSLAAQIASALRSAEVYRQTLAAERAMQELALAGEIQASFLPTSIPPITGWQLAVALESAREASGDFYDIIPLPGDRLGLIVADVADKGVGAALYMALSRTLIRTHALQYPDSPARVLSAANERILQDTASDQFVTVFYGVLDPASGGLTYCNAGHNPPYLLQYDAAPQALARTGIPLGMFEDQAWQEATVHLTPGATLLAYSDGITEAVDAAGDLFGEARMLAAAERGLSGSGNETTVDRVRQVLLDAIQLFVGATPQADDITLMVLHRSA
ncbi:MAG: PP2C family protein-serine/threonine phosphatase [Anaerolineae bacterium]|nr:PP2C family protein-serine/threonine phosphatase [Anaerolineae bacterium]